VNELILIDKPAGMTSFGVVARVRRVLSERASAEAGEKRKIKVGHTGTLDPFATGLLILLSGKMTKKSDEFLKLDKVYLAEARLGATSTTGDPEGEITEVAAKPPELPEVEEVLRSFVGEIKQTPPIFSAIKIGGRRAYDLARKGEKPKMPERNVTIYDIELVGYAYPRLTMRVHCSSGTYIRTLAEDIGRRLGCRAYLTALRREKIGGYSVGDTRTLADFGVAEQQEARI
jgi:tRNA pseudouridine55 synthase